MGSNPDNEQYRLSKREKEEKGNDGNLGTSITKLRSIMAIALTGGITLISTLSLSE
jgi:hypothetical protein